MTIPEQLSESLLGAVLPDAEFTAVNVVPAPQVCGAVEAVLQSLLVKVPALCH